MQIRRMLEIGNGWMRRRLIQLCCKFFGLIENYAIKILNLSIVISVFRKWSPGEPFDHAGGRERCAILNINRKTLEDVDCDLGGNPLNFYRFICERTHLHHIKVKIIIQLLLITQFQHEELNNPLWKKLEDILVFFGISQSSAAATNETSPIASDPVQLDDEDYMDMAKLNATESPKVEGSGEEPKPTEQQKATEWTADPEEDDEILSKTTEDAKPAKTVRDF
jgi:hypothetical protein